VAYSDFAPFSGYFRVGGDSIATRKLECFLSGH
jgi:hypothetical protein